MTTILGTLLTLAGLVVGVPLAGAALLALLSMVLWVGAVSVDEQVRRPRLSAEPDAAGAKGRDRLLDR